ncbi:hypothetical protein KN248_013000 [Mycobacterium paraintracellulare]|uniref:hypothetical protein n=1 Tax=Mycobacterium paraintracellulare TaxID=1138383 RepID=UPI001EEE1266|nr:hypothetical protein [Mycobacterium paraintracellulare]WVL46271.1 hypothetical protein KN248_013000 [Mycobacterium paraintracellulare]
MGDFKFEINKAGMEQLERELQEQFSAGLQIPLEGSEDDAVRTVVQQLSNMGATPNEPEVRRIVREARGG